MSARSFHRLGWGLQTAIFAGMLLILVPGCESRMLWSYRDDPYLAEYAKLGEEECLRKLNSVYTDDRRVALRVLAHMAAEYARQGEAARADRLVQYIIEQFGVDKSRKVRCAIVCVCMPECGRGSRRAETFLRRLIAGGEWSVEAAFSLAAISPAQGVSLLEPLTRHPSAQIRYQAAMALTVLGDPGGAGAARRVVMEMRRSGWPRSIGEKSLRAARDCLRRRVERLWGRAGNMVDAPRSRPRIKPLKRFKPRPGPSLPEFSKPAARGRREE